MPRSAAARRAGAGTRPLSASGVPRRTRASPPTSPRPRSRRSPMPRRSAAIRSISTKRDLFDMEYWSLEQAKLGAAPKSRSPDRSLPSPAAAARIGAATARAFAEGRRRSRAARQGCRSSRRYREDHRRLSAASCDVTDAAAVHAAFDTVAEIFGGVDIRRLERGRDACRRAGSARSTKPMLRKSFELNFYGHQRAAQAAVKIMLAQGTGGCLLFNVSKQAINPGPNFGPYGLPKAATLFLCASTRSITAPTASAPTPSTPTASAPGSSPTTSSRSAPRRAASPRRTT